MCVWLVTTGFYVSILCSKEPNVFTLNHFQLGANKQKTLGTLFRPKHKPGPTDGVTYTFTEWSDHWLIALKISDYTQMTSNDRAIFISS